MHRSLAGGALLLAAVLALPPRARAAPAPLQAPLGASYAGWRGQFAQPERRLQQLKDLGFPLVTLVPAYAYVGRDRIDFATGPSWEELGAALEAALRAGFTVVIKPHLNGSLYRPGNDPLASEDHSWRAQVQWRGFLDVDPMSRDYRQGLVFGMLKLLASTFARTGPPPAPVRLELGVELMNSVVALPHHWGRLLAEARRELRRLGLAGRVLLSHNFSHHLALPDDQVDRMDRAGRRALAHYIQGLDAVALSQYMDLTAAMPAAERGQRLPTADEVARALVQHEQALRTDILQRRLGLTPRQIPPLHIGEFGIGRGGLRHPNLWSGAATPDQEKALAAEIARGFEGLARYLSLTPAEGRTAASAVLWVTGWRYDIFGWGNPAHGVPEAAAVVRAALATLRRPGAN